MQSQVVWFVREEVSIYYLDLKRFSLDRLQQDLIFIGMVPSWLTARNEKRAVLGLRCNLSVGFALSGNREVLQSMPPSVQTRILLTLSDVKILPYDDTY